MVRSHRFPRPLRRSDLPWTTYRPTPIRISRRLALGLSLAAGALSLLLLWRAPAVLTFLLGGASLAIVLSFPVRLLSLVMPRGMAILLSFLLVLTIGAVALIGVAPVLVEQLGALVTAIPGIAQRIGTRLPELLEPLAERGLLPVSIDQFVDDLKSELLAAIATFGTRVLGGIAPLVSGLIGAAITAFGIVFIAAYLLADARKLHCWLLQAAPRGYRRDVRDLWDAFVFRLSRYLGGLAISLGVQGALSGVALYFIGVPYPVLLGTWVSLTALVPYLGAWIGGAPAVLVALSISPTAALVTLLLFVAIQQLEGNVLTPRIQGQAVRVHPILIFLAVITGGELAGLPGVIFAVPAVAVLRVLYDFFAARLRVATSDTRAWRPAVSDHDLRQAGPGGTKEILSARRWPRQAVPRQWHRAAGVPPPSARPIARAKSRSRSAQ